MSNASSPSKRQHHGAQAGDPHHSTHTGDAQHSGHATSHVSHPGEDSVRHAWKGDRTQGHAGQPDAQVEVDIKVEPLYKAMEAITEVNEKQVAQWAKVGGGLLVEVRRFSAANHMLRMLEVAHVLLKNFFAGLDRSKADVIVMNMSVVIEGLVRTQSRLRKYFDDDLESETFRQLRDHLWLAWCFHPNRSVLKPLMPGRSAAHLARREHVTEETAAEDAFRQFLEAMAVQDLTDLNKPRSDVTNDYDTPRTENDYLAPLSARHQIPAATTALAHFIDADGDGTVGHNEAMELLMQVFACPVVSVMLCHRLTRELRGTVVMVGVLDGRQEELQVGVSRAARAALRMLVTEAIQVHAMSCSATLTEQTVASLATKRTNALIPKSGGTAEFTTMLTTAASVAVEQGVFALVQDVESLAEQLWAHLDTDQSGQVTTAELVAKLGQATEEVILAPLLGIAQPLFYANLLSGPLLDELTLAAIDEYKMSVMAEKVSNCAVCSGNLSTLGDDCVVQ
mmetsp:Transcript_21185/g.53991  ORF Transcript_21185/g.53991 Transcript_21185/m.53991 type:complete len:509 (-) Transcript_21185:420-1946(-)